MAAGVSVVVLAGEVTAIVVPSAAKARKRVITDRTVFEDDRTEAVGYTSVRARGESRRLIKLGFVH